MKDTFISSEGGISRSSFILRIILLSLLTYGASKVAIDYFDQWHNGNYSPLGPFIGIVVTTFCLMIALMQLLKRLRNIGKPAYWSLLMLVPVVNILILLYVAFAPPKA